MTNLHRVILTVRVDVVRAEDDKPPNREHAVAAAQQAVRDALYRACANGFNHDHDDVCLADWHVKVDNDFPVEQPVPKEDP